MIETALQLLLLLPAITVLLLLFRKELKHVRFISLGSALVQFAICILLASAFFSERSSGNENDFLFEFNHAWFPSLSISFHLGVDGISLGMLLLTALVVLAGVLVSWNEGRMSREFFILLFLLSMGAYGFFMSLDLFTMFFFLELAVIPKFLLIGIWGSGKKEYSAMKLALMLMAGSALVLVGILALYVETGTFSIPGIAGRTLPIEFQQMFFPFLMAGFGIFTALFPFHSWVPDGHSSAPTAASMFLAGISMKLGGYGCLRVATWLMPEAAQQYSWIIVLLATIAILYGAFATMMQTDLKYMNAYSSVSHCGFVLLGIGMLTETALEGAVLQMISHGLMTALFFAVIGIIYERTHTRQISEMGGLMKLMPFTSTVFVLVGLCSLGLPGLSGFVAEMTVFTGSWQRTDLFYRICTILSCASIVVTAVYILRAAGTILMGTVAKQEYATIHDAGWNEKAASWILLAAILIMGLAPFLLQELIEPVNGWLASQPLNEL